MVPQVHSECEALCEKSPGWLYLETAALSGITDNRQIHEGVLSRYGSVFARSEMCSNGIAKSSPGAWNQADKPRGLVFV
jgi:hypothetical protein